MKVNELLNHAEQQLQQVDNARLDAEILLAFVMNTDRVALYAHPEKKVSQNKIVDFYSLINKRTMLFPVAYLTGHKEFWSIDFNINQSTLIPRPETETLIESALDLIPDNVSMSILDLGTGCGAISIALAKERPLCNIIAVDISNDALAVAQTNIMRHGITNVELRQSDWFSAIKENMFDLIVCNPPYVDSQSMAFVETDIQYEPRVALDGGYQGIQILNNIIPAAYNHLVNNGYFLLEHGHDQGEAIRYTLSTNHYIDITTIKDYAGLDRVSLGRCP